MPALSINLLGNLNLTYADTSLTSVKTERLQALLAYILLHRDRPQLRQQIAVQLWPEASESDAKANLRRRLHELRQLLPESDRFLRVEPKFLQWVGDAPYTLDVADFEAAIATAQTPDPTIARQALTRAADLYRDELLPSCYDDWIIAPRDRLKQQAIDSLDRLVRLLLDQADWQGAIRYAQQLLQLNPLCETAYCHLMRSHAQLGDRASALQVYHRCMTVLREALGVSPSPSTCQLYEQLLTMEDEALSSDRSGWETCDRAASFSLTNIALPSLPEPPVATIPLIGRAAEWATVQTWKTYQQTADREALLLLTGEPGIGKTRLLEALAQQVRTEGGVVLWGRGFEAEMLRPYGVWMDAFRASQANEFLSEMAALLQSEPTDAMLNRSRLLDAGVQLIQSLAAHHSPVLIVLDDIQWLDDASIAFLHYAARLLSQHPVLFALAARQRELDSNLAVSKFLQTLQREQRLQRLQLGPLDLEHTAELVHQVSQTVNGERVFTDSGGNPLFILEVARVRSAATEPGASDLAALIRGRLLLLDDQARHLVFWAAALGRSFSPTTLAQVVNCSLPQLLTTLEHLEQHGILRPGSALTGECCYDFAHDIVRQIAYQQLSDPRRRLIHSHIAQALNQSLAQHPDEVGNVAYHASLGGDHLLAATAALAAAERHLRLFAYAEAAEVAQQGIRHCQPLELADRLPLQLRLLRTHVKAGVRKDQGAELAEALQQLTEQAAANDLKDAEAIGLEALMLLNYDHGQLAQVYQHSLQAAEQARLASPATTAYMLARTGSCLAEIGREMVRAEALLLEAQSVAERVGLQPIDIPAGLGCIYRYQGHVSAARESLEQGWQLAQTEQDHWRECSCLMNLVMLALEADDPVTALSYCDELTAVAAQMGEGSEASHAAALDALIHYWLGTPSAEERLARSQQTLAQIDSPRMVAYSQTMAARFDLQQGWVKQAAERAEAALAAAKIVNNPSEMALAWAVIIQASLQQGNHSCAARHLASLRQKTDSAPLSHSASQALQAIEMQLQPVSSQ
ncbi:MAG: AAA family ATPase [Leptolyngbya sp. SIO4C1]|nr:AAA family ATPase [Leptolyngbya sp. SIO4C1]